MTRHIGPWLSVSSAAFPHASSRHPPTPPCCRLKKIQDLSPVDVEAALGKLPSDVSPDCVALLRRIFAIEPAQRPSLTGACKWGAGGWL